MAWMWSERLEPVRKSYIKIDEQTTPEIVPKQIENLQRDEMALSNDEEEQVSDQMPDQQTVGQFSTIPQSAVQEQLKEVTQFWKGLTCSNFLFKWRDRPNSWLKLPLVSK